MAKFSYKHLTWSAPDVDVLHQREEPYFYHVAPTEDRARIQQYGLRPSNPRLHTDRLFNSKPEDAPKALYLHPYEEGAQRWLDMLNNEFYSTQHPYAPKTSQFDIWRVPRENLTNLFWDPKASHIAPEHEYHYTTTPVMGELHRPVEEDQYWPNELERYEQKREERNEGTWAQPQKEWGIGLPDRVIGRTATRVVDLEHLQQLQDHYEQNFSDPHQNTVPFIYDPTADVVYKGMPGGFHSDMHETLKGQLQSQPYNGRLNQDRIEWYGKPPQQEALVNHALGVQPGDIWEFASADLNEQVEQKLQQQREENRVKWGQEFPYGTATPPDDPTGWGLSHEPGVPATHSTGWIPGQYGKGIVFDNGAVHTWGLNENYDDGPPWHSHYLEEHNYDPKRLKTPLYIDPNGDTYVDHPFGNIVQKSDPRLKVVERAPEENWFESKTAEIRDVPGQQIEMGHGLERQPFVYKPDEEVLYLGVPGSYHHGLTDWEYGSEGAYIGAYWPKEKVAEVYPTGFNDEEYGPHHLKNIQEKLGADSIHNTEWEHIAVPNQHTNQEWNFFGRRVQADKLHDFLMNPKSRPDLQTPEAQAFLQTLKDGYHNEKTDALMPWLTREWKKGRIHHTPGWPHPLHYQGPHWQVSEGDRYEDGSPKFLLPSRRLDHWGDFMNSNHPIRRELGDIMQKKIPEFHEHIENWDNAMNEEADQKAKEEAAKGGEIVHQWPDGWSMRRLHTPEELKNEGDVMGHCVGGYHGSVAEGHSSIYSLRDPEGQPHVTTEIAPKYVVDESGHKHKRDNLEGPFSSHEMNPEGGDLVQIQGKGNREPIDEYKQRMKEWFETFEKRPKSDNDHEYITRPDEIDDNDLKPVQKYDEYGLEHRPSEPDWGSIMGFHTDPYYTDRIHQLAVNRGEVPQAGHALEDELQNAYEDYDEMEEMNRDSMYENTGPHPEFITDPNEAEQWGYAAPWEHMTPEQQNEALKTHERNEGMAQEDLFRDWSRNHDTYEPLKDLHEKFSPWRDQAGNYSETPKYAFSSWQI